MMRFEPIGEDKLSSAEALAAVEVLIDGLEEIIDIQGASRPV